MKLKAEEAIKALDIDELYNLRSDIKKGSIWLKKKIDDRLKELENARRGSCTICGETLEGKENTYTIIFGPDYFRRKASFCAVDCLQYFLMKMKKLEKDIKND